MKSGDSAKSGDNEKDSIKKEETPIASTSAVSLGSYRHRMLRVRRDLEHNVRINGRRHRPGQLVRGGEPNEEEAKLTEPAGELTAKEQSRANL